MKTNPYTVILNYPVHDHDEVGLYTEWVDVNTRCKNQRRKAIELATQKCWEANGWTKETADEMGDIVVFPGHIQDI